MIYLFVLIGIALVILAAFLEGLLAKRRNGADLGNLSNEQTDEKTEKKKRIKLKRINGKYLLPVVIIGVLLTIRYFTSDRELGDIIGLAASPISPALTAISGVLLWLEAAAVLVVLLYPFYDFKNVNNLVKYFATPVFVLCIGFLLPVLRLFASYGDALNLCVVAMSAEIGGALTVCAFAWVRDRSFKISRGEVIALLCSLLPIILAALPPYVIQLFFGRANPLIAIKKITTEHRIFLYSAFVIPLLIYYALRHKSKEVIHFSLLYLSLVTMVSYSFNYTFADITNPLHWPLHLCNTAMFIIPICLIFKWDKLFYFTYFINVMGAFLAMAMPNYSDGTNLYSTALVIFWINHFCAFFMPLLLVALKVFARPKLRQFWYSMAGFGIYFLIVLIANGWFSNYGEVDYFFLNSDFIVSKLGVWAEKTRFIRWEFDIGQLHFIYYPLYQVLFFIVYVGIAFAMWFIYEQFFAMFDLHGDMFSRYRKFRQDKYAMLSSLNGREKSEPMYTEDKDKLILQNFGKRYGTSNVYAVKNADLEVHAGEIFGFLGPNGAGKSTIIKSIVGIQPITEGTIKVCGYDVEKQSVEAKRQIGYVPDHYALYERLTGREYINYIADIYDVSKEDRDERVQKYVELFELQGAIDNNMRTYSHGMKQKITIMAALVHNPKLWILDEPLTGLDPNSIYQVKECMKLHAKEGNIVFFSSHIIDVVERICDRITIIKKGKILCTRNVADFGDDNPLEDFYLKTIGEADVERDEIFTEEKKQNKIKRHKKGEKA